MELIFYKDNPNLGLPIVSTIKGETEYRVNCRRIKHKGAYNFYTIGKDCFLIEGTYYRKESELIDFDFETKTYFTIANNINRIRGVVSTEKQDNIFVLKIGWFTPNIYNNVNFIDKDGMKYTAISRDILDDCIEDISNGVFFPKHTLLQSSINEISRIRNTVNHQNKGYNIEDNDVEFQNKKDSYLNYPTPLSKDVRVYARMLSGLTYGLEIETIRGYLPDNLQNRHGVVICRDGSLKDENGGLGAEYVTVPYSGAKGLQTIVSLCDDLKNRNDIDIHCSLHIHAGNIQTDRLYLISLYKLCLNIQDEVFEMFPYYKTDPSGYKQKNYNQKLKSLFKTFNLCSLCKEDYNYFVNNSYERLFRFLSQGYDPCKQFNRENKKHPSTHKWNRDSRYFWVNFMNAIFSNRNTIEFRLHTPTQNAQKIINWLFIINAICRYASFHSKEILTSDKIITFKQVLDYYKNTFSNEKATFLSDYLYAYFEERKELFRKDLEKNDKLSAWEMNNDKDYIFKFNGVTHLF